MSLASNLQFLFYKHDQFIISLGDFPSSFLFKSYNNFIYKVVITHTLIDYNNACTLS